MIEIDIIFIDYFAKNKSNYFIKSPKTNLWIMISYDTFKDKLGYDRVRAWREVDTKHLDFFVDSGSAKLSMHELNYFFENRIKNPNNILHEKYYLLLLDLGMKVRK